MFHIVCPRFRGFMTWDDLGCLARAVGFPTDLFKSNITKHVTAEEHGMSVQQVNKMLDLRLLQKSIHRTRNLHTGEWNTKVIRKALYLMDHHALTFEELYNIRIAYKAYEGNDMRGMPLDERTMLSALKMCGRSIAPLKMMHRIKHMSVNFEEPDRMQLFEFLDLVLWADLYEEFTFESMERAEGKEGDLFKLVDFELLLSHHDKKLADRLNHAYLQEEWDFGQEILTGDKSKFKEPPVICGEQRVQMARDQKLKFRYLKSELINSHRKMYRAKAGYIRDRPITAPDLSMYVEEEAPPPPPEFTAQTAYEIVQRKVKSANAAVGRTPPDLSDKPHIPSPQKIWTAKAVSDAEIEETQKQYDNLKFDIETVHGRFEFHKEKEIEYYFPGQSERLCRKQEEKEESVASEMKKSTTSHSQKPKITQKEVNRLAYPPSRLPPSHAKACDARFRGWHNIKNKKGSHFVLVAPSFENSYTGRLHKKLVETSNAPVKKVKGDFVHRYTKKADLEKPMDQKMRPYTAPANLQSGETELEEEAVISITESPDTGYGSMEDKLGEGSSAESLTKSPDHKISDDSLLTSELKASFPRPFEKPKSKEKDIKDIKNQSTKAKERTILKDQLESDKQKQPNRKVTSVNSTKIESRSLQNHTMESKSIGPEEKDVDHKIPEHSINISSHKNSTYPTDDKNGNLKYKPHDNVQNKSDKSAVTPEKRTQSKCEKIELSAKIDNLKKDLNKPTLEKRAINNQRKTIKSPPALEFTFTSFLNNSLEKEDFEDLKHTTDKSSKSAWFEDDLLSPESTPRMQQSESPRMPEPTVYTKPKTPKVKIDIENLPVPHFEYSKPKTISVGAIGKISLLESITESKFWEDMIEESYRLSEQEPKDEVFVNDELNVNCKEKELADLKEEDFEDDVSNDSGVGGFDVKTKPKTSKKKQGTGDNIDEKLMKAKEDRLKRQKRVLKGSNFEKMGITVTKNSRGSKLSTSSDTSRGKSTSSEASNKDQNVSEKVPIISKPLASSKSKLKSDKKCEQKNINIEIPNPEMKNKTNSHKIQEKQKKFCESMKRLVGRMDGTMSVDLRNKMLSTRLS